VNLQGALLLVKMTIKKVLAKGKALVAREFTRGFAPCKDDN